MRMNIKNISKGIIVGVFALFSSLSAVAQSERDAQNMTEKALNGTAKSQAMGGALGAIGADPSAISINPAGLGVYMRGELSGTFSFGNMSVNSSWGIGDITTGTSNTSLGSFDQITYVGTFNNFFTGKNRYNFSFSYNKEKDYRRKYGMSASNMPTSIADYAARTAIGISAGELFEGDGNHPYDNIGLSWFPIFAYNGGIIEEMKDDDRLYQSAFQYGNYPNNPSQSTLSVEEKGNISSFDLSFGVSLNDYVYLGATLRSYSLSFVKNSFYSERFNGGPFYDEHVHEYGSATIDDHLEIRNTLMTNGTGVGGIFGVLVNIGDYGRIGLSYLTPQYFTLEDSYVADITSYVWGLDKNSAGEPGNASVNHMSPEAFTEYKLIRPGTLTASAMIRLGRFGMVSYDLDYTNMGKMRMHFHDGVENVNNQYINEYYGPTIIHRVGAELKPIPRLAVRAGAAFYGNPITDQHLLTEVNNSLSTDVGATGTMTDFVLTKGMNSYYTAGLGYNITNRFTIDAAYIHNSRELMAYPYTASEITIDDRRVDIPSKGGLLKQTSNRVAFTLSYRF